MKIRTTWIEGSQEEENEITLLLEEVKKAGEVINPKKQSLSFIDFQPDTIIDRAAGAEKGFWVKSEKGLPVEIATPTRRARVIASTQFGADFQGVVQTWEITHL